MTVVVQITPRTKEVLISVGSHLAKHRNGLRKALTEIGYEVVRDVRRLIRNGPKTGRIYRYRGRDHQASAPGEAPANRSGRLAESAGHRVRGYYEMAVGLEEYYGKFLEDGTKKMKPRPVLIKSVTNKARDTEISILDNVNKEIYGL